MRRWTFKYPAPALFAIVALLGADEPLRAKHSRTVGSVYRRSVTEDDIGLTAPIDPAIRFDAQDEARWHQMRRILATFGDPVIDNFVKRQKIQATIDEVERFTNNSRKRTERNILEWEARLAGLKQRAAAPNLSHVDKMKLQKELELYERLVAANRKPLAAGATANLARMFIIAWKIERDLHGEYGGRVIHQQGGLEALDARRLLFEEAERNGEVKFNDAGVRHMFYYYANMNHVIANDIRALEKPWFLDSEE